MSTFGATSTIPDELFEEASKKLLAAQRIAVVSHITPDHDAVGSAGAMMLALDQLGKDYVAVVGQRNLVDPTLMSIPCARKITPVDRLPECDLVVVLDCGASARTGILQPEILEDLERVILVDHHSTNRGFAGVNLIDKEAESTTTVLGYWLGMLGVELTKDIAHCLYAGLAADTGGFKWGRPAMYSYAQVLADTGLDLRGMSQELFDIGSLEDLIMIGKVLEHLRRYDVLGLNVIVGVVSFDLAHGHPRSAVEGIADMVRGVRGSDVVVVFKEYSPGDWAVSLRSDCYNVSLVAKELGGGGHVHSSGYTTFGTREHVISQVLDVIADRARARGSAT